MSQANRILLVADFGSTGGTRTFLEELLDFYHSMAWHVDLVPSMSIVDSRLRAACDKLDVTVHAPIRGHGHTSGTTTWRRPGGGSARRRSSRADYEALARELGSTHRVVSTGRPGALLEALSPDLSSIYILHTYPHGRRQNLLGNWLVGPAIPGNALLVAVSEHQRQLVRQMWCRWADRRIALIRNVPPARVPAGRPSSTPIPVVTIGALESYKEPHVWLDAAAAWWEREQGNEAHPAGSQEWLWVGSGSLESAVRRHADEHDLRGHVRFVGEVVDPTPLLSRARVYVQTSSIENMSFSVLEAMNLGIPCVVTDAGALPEIIEHGVSGIIVPQGDPQAVASAVSRLLEDVQLSGRLAAAAKEVILARHDQALWQAAMRRVHAIAVGALSP